MSWLSVCTYVRTWTFHVDTITFEGVSGSKPNLVGVFYVWNVGLVLKSKVKSWSWSWSSSWKGFWFLKKLYGTIPNLVGIFKTLSITLVIDVASGILILILILKKKKSEKMLWNKTEFHEHHQHVVTPCVRLCLQLRVEEYFESSTGQNCLLMGAV